MNCRSCFGILSAILDRSVVILNYFLINEYLKKINQKFFIQKRRKISSLELNTFVEEFCRAEAVGRDEHVNVERVAEAIVHEQLARRLSAHHVVVVVVEFNKRIGTPFGH